MNKPIFTPEAAVPSELHDPAPFRAAAASERPLGCRAGALFALLCRQGALELFFIRS